VELAAKEMNSQVEIKVDQFGYRWMLLHDPDWEDLVALVHMAGNTMDEKGFGEQLLAAAFRLEREEQSPEPLYIIFTYKRGTFYPFLPRAAGHQQRDQGEEMHVYSLMEKELPWEKDLSRWYPLWGCPV
ncbi:MAG: PspA-associated protein PspAB, partial [Bacillota bacterium]